MQKWQLRDLTKLSRATMPVFSYRAKDSSSTATLLARSRAIRLERHNQWAVSSLSELATLLSNQGGFEPG